MVNTNFFENKKSWSLIKDDLLEYYLKLYFQKILFKGSVVYIDCFAGKGKFDNGQDGSPIIAIKAAEAAIKNSRLKRTDIKFIFIEQKYAEDLRKNTAEYNNVEVLEGDYEKNIIDILNKNKGSNVFLYIDPFGIKYLHYDIFNKLKHINFKSIELLINFNAFGFFRDGCRLLRDQDIEGNFEEYDSREEESISIINNVPNMDRVANGDYWQALINDYYSKTITSHEVEEIITSKYCGELKKIFRYIINIPIKSNVDKMPKYRMIFCTNNAHGYIEMANNMNKRWKDLQDKSNKGQITLFDIDVDYKASFFERNIKSIILNVINKSSGSQYRDLLCTIISNEGIMYSLKEMDQCIRELEESKQIIIKRVPPLTKKTKQPAKWISYKNDMRIFKNEKC